MKRSSKKRKTIFNNKFSYTYLIITSDFYTSNKRHSIRKRLLICVSCVLVWAACEKKLEKAFAAAANPVF